MNTNNTPARQVKGTPWLFPLRVIRTTMFR